MILVSIVVGALASLALSTGRQSEFSSTSDRNREQALGVAEAAVSKVMSRVSSQATYTPSPSAPDFWSMLAGTTLPAGCAPGGTCAAARTDTTAATGYAPGSFSGTTPQGEYWYWVTRCSPATVTCPGAGGVDGFIVDSESKTGGTTLKRTRHVQVTLTPPTLFPHSEKYAMFSNTTIVVQNNDQVLYGDIFANESIFIYNSNKIPTVQGSLTSATGWIQLDSGVIVTGNVWSGGFKDLGGANWAINLGGSAAINGWAKASITNPTDPTTCNSEPHANYNVQMANASHIDGGLTTWGAPTGPGTVSGPQNFPVCTAASARKTLPDFDGSAYKSPTVFNTVAGFQGWMYCSGGLTNLKGVFFVLNEPAPAQTGNGTNCGNETSYHRIDLTGAKLKGPLTIVSNAPIYTGTLDDSEVPCTQSPCNSTMILVSHYDPPPSTSCSTVDDNSECAVHIKNNFSLDASGVCKTATLAYADKGPVAVKNGSTMCGSIIADGILVKNNQKLQYDDRIGRLLGFGETTYGITQWNELPAK